MCCNLVYYPDENQTECVLFGQCVRPCPHFNVPADITDFESCIINSNKLEEIELSDDLPF